MNYILIYKKIIKMSMNISIHVITLMEIFCWNFYTEYTLRNKIIATIIYTKILPNFK